MFRSILSSLTPRDLQREKRKDYRNIVIIQVVIIVFGLTLSEVIITDSTSAAGKLVATVYVTFAAGYAFLLWDLLRNFTTSRLLINTVFLVVIAIVIIGILGDFPYYRFIDVPDRQLYLLFLHGMIFPIEVTVIGFAIRDLFSGQVFTDEKLWGAASVFLMIGISFGSLYDLICISRPGSLGEQVELGLANYALCMQYSLSTLGGMDSPFPNASRLIKNISVIEAVWGNLFVVLVIGKLLGLPRASTSENINKP